MPIRMNRGRAAVYRRLWAWPLRSPRHLAVAVVTFAVLATVVGILIPENPDPVSARTAASRGTTSSTAQPSRPSSTASSGTQRPAVTTTPPAPAPPAPEALAVASAWANAWVNHPAGITNEQWTAQLAPLTTDEFIPQLRTIDPSNIPSTRVTGPPTPTKSTAKAVELDIVTDGAVLHLTVIATPVGWRVSAYDRSG
jgi:hypothetical protein